MNINEEIERDKDERISDGEPAENAAEETSDTSENTENADNRDSDDLNYEPIIGTYTHDDMFEQLIRAVNKRSAEKKEQEKQKRRDTEVSEYRPEDAPGPQEDLFEQDSGGEDIEQKDILLSGEEFSDDELPEGGEIPDSTETEIAEYSDEGYEHEEREVEETPPEHSDPVSNKPASDSLAEKIKKSNVLKPAVIKEMFFGSRDIEHRFAPEENDTDDEDLEDPVEFDRSRRRRTAADPERDKKIFSVEYMLDPELAADGYMLFYNEFVLKKNIKITLIFGFLALVFLFSVMISPKGYLNYTLLLITLSIIAMRWINSSGAKRDALLSAEDVKNDSYRLDFYNSRILLKASEIVDDKIYSYPPVMIRFEDIELKVLDYEELYVLIFKKNYVYTIPKSAMNDEQKDVFKGMLENILGDDYYEFYSREKEAEERAEKRRLKKEAKTGKKSDQ